MKKSKKKLGSLLGNKEDTEHRKTTSNSKNE